MSIVVADSTFLQSLASSQPYAPLFFQCPNVPPRSICPAGLKFTNQDNFSDYADILALDIAAPDFLEKLFTKIMAKTVDRTAESLVTDELRMYGILFVDGLINSLKSRLHKTGITNLPQEWTEFLERIGTASFFGAMSGLNLGRCAEAASISMVHTLQKQLKWGFRETIAQVSLERDDHTFVIYNADFAVLNQAAKSIHNFTEFSELMAKLQPHDSNRPVIICDTWIEYNGPATGWLKHYQKRILQASEHVAKPQAVFMKVADFSIPSFRKDRDEFNAKTRKLLKETMLKILALYNKVTSLDDVATATVAAERRVLSI